MSHIARQNAHEEWHGHPVVLASGGSVSIVLVKFKVKFSAVERIRKSTAVDHGFHEWSNKKLTTENQESTMVGIGKKMNNRWHRCSVRERVVSVPAVKIA